MIVKQSFKVKYEYEVVYTRDLFNPEDTILSRLVGDNRSNVMVFMDENVAAAFPNLVPQIGQWAQEHPESLKLISPVEIVPGGEVIKKGWSAIDSIVERMMAAGLCRHSYVIIVGGGAVLDAVSFAASIFHRGVKQIKVPTTMLSQDDSGVGVKNSINHQGVKNLLGCFYPPDAVVIDYQFLRTLDNRDILSGVAEALKVAFIKDKDLYGYIRDNSTKISEIHWPTLEYLVLKSSQLHLQHIGGGDPFEKGSSRPLDFGHWSAHKLEALTENEIRHGEAVAIGMALDIYCAAILKMITLQEAEEMIETMQSCGLALWHDALTGRDESGRLQLIRGLEEFREHLGGRLTLAMPTGIGAFVDVHELPDRVIEKALARLQTRHGVQHQQADTRQVLRKAAGDLVDCPGPGS